MKEQINIAIIDNHQVYRKGLKVVLSNLPVKVVAEGGNSKDLQYNDGFRSADIILLDIGMQCTSCGENLINFLKENSRAQVIGMVQHYEHIRIDEMRDVGMNGFFIKNTNRREIELAVETVLSGTFYMPDTYRKLKTNKL
jgi:DNA-binding NarL/FixJ family response regulator